MEIILKLIFTPIVLFIAAKLMPTVFLKNIKAAVITSLLILLVGFLIGWLLTLFFNVLTLGLFWLVGLGIVTRTIAYTFIIEIVDKMGEDFNTKGFLPSL